MQPPLPPKTPFHRTTTGAVTIITALAVLIVLVLLTAAVALTAGGTESETNQASDNLADVQFSASRLKACDNHDRMCHESNAMEIRTIAAITGADKTSALGRAIADFNNQYPTLAERTCGVNTRDYVCGITGIGLNLATNTAKVEVSKLTEEDAAAWTK